MADYELGGVVRSRIGQRAAGRRAVERVPDRRRRRGGDRRQRRHRVRPAVRGDGRARAGRRPRFATHDARGENMAELDALVGRVDARRCRATRSLELLLDEHGVPAGRIFTAPDMLTDPQYLAREMVQRSRPPRGGRCR